MPNHLINETSPYLLQHASNPVDWYPWGEEALARARQENKPIFLSIGYAACHWCHVMSHESFEDPRTAALLNEHFISIKVDREQRPDLDSIYMRATTALTGSGGWPMSVFLTPDLRPFYAGTYFPPVRRYNMPPFTDVLRSIVETWEKKPAEIDRVASQVFEHLSANQTEQSSDAFTRQSLYEAARALVESYDRENGGWGVAPKFPQPMAIEFLLRRAGPAGATPDELTVALHALRAMARGGIYDVVGGGFSRYSTDNFWRVPHFEKMLYDNAQLALAYLHAWQITGDAFFKRITQETLDFVAREMTHPQGGFYSSLDADSEGVEGKYYAWTKDELRAALKDDSRFALFAAAYGVSERGNWEGKTLLQRALDDATLASRFGMDTSEIPRVLSESHSVLLRARSSRVRPATDDKVLTSWNALMLQAFAQASRFIGDDAQGRRYLLMATRNAAFLLSELRPVGQLRHAWRNGAASPQVFLEDFANLMLGLLDLYEANFEDRWFVAAVQLADEMIERCSDPGGGFFDTPADAGDLPLRPKDLQDNATPSGNARACEALLRLEALTGKGAYRDRAEEALRLAAGDAVRYPIGFARWLNAADLALSDGQQLAIVYGKREQLQPMLEVVNAKYRPDLTVAASAHPPRRDAPALLADRPLLEGRATAYLCHHFVCRSPVNSPEDLRLQLAGDGSVPARDRASRT